MYRSRAEYMGWHAVRVSIRSVASTPGCLRAGLPGGRGEHLHVLGHDAQRLSDLVDVERLDRLHHDRIPLLQARDLLEGSAVSVAVPGHGEVADLAGQSGLGVVAHALDVED